MSYSFIKKHHLKERGKLNRSPGDLILSTNSRFGALWIGYKSLL
jgi:hypothetical protein